MFFGKNRLYAISLVWMFVIILGLVNLFNYEFTPGTMKKVSKFWPTNTNIRKLSAPYQAVMAIHPHCPCTRATLNELAFIMARTQGKLEVTLLFFKPSLFDEEWAKSDLWYSSKRIPNVIPKIDDDGLEAAHFGAMTSGQVLVYDLEGNLLFNGGITSSRGHEGSCLGRNAIISLVLNGSSDTQSTPFFGCPLFSEP